MLIADEKTKWIQNAEGYENLPLVRSHGIFHKSDDPNVKLSLTRGLVKELSEWKEGCIDPKKDDDYVCVFTGEVGAGKSSLAIQMASIWNDSLMDINRHVHYDTKTLIKHALKADKGELFVLDESFSDMAAINRGKKETERMYAWLNLARKRNLGMIFLTPELFDLGRYVIFERAKMWIRCLLEDKWKKGHAIFYNREAILYHKKKGAREDRKYYGNTGFHFRFTRGYGYVKTEDYKKKSNDEFEKRFADINDEGDEENA